MRARRQARWLAPVSAAMLTPAFAEAIEPASRPIVKPPPQPSMQPAMQPPQRPRPARTYRPYIDRGNSIPAPYALGSLGVATNVHVGLPPQAELSVGFAVGLSPRIWLDGSVGTLRVAPSFVFHSAQIGPNVLLIDVPAFELDAMIHVSAPSDDHRPIEQIEPGLYAVAHVHHAVRVDAFVGFDVNPGPKTTFGVRVPTSLAFQLTDHVYASVNTGVTLANFADPRESTAIPAGISFGWSDYLSPADTPIVAISPSISFPQLVKPWAQDPFRPGVLTCGVTFYYVWKY